MEAPVAAHPDASASSVMIGGRVDVGLLTIARYLAGSRNAIRAMAAQRDTVWLGLLLVMSAALAREYDGEDLLYEPWHLLLPLGASLGTSFLLYCLTFCGVAWYRGVRLTSFWGSYRTFLGLYWMTAPLAWLYAIPVERFLNAGDATSANLWFLGIVSLWRVLLITRVCSVLFGGSPYSLFFVVMLFADTLALTLVSRVDVQILAVMGGVRLTEAESVLADTKLMVLFLGAISLPVWMIGTVWVAGTPDQNWSWSISQDSKSHNITIPTWCFAGSMILVWSLLLPWTQPVQQLRGQVERAFRAGRYDEVLATMSAHQRVEFPPHWDPPPRTGSARERPRILKVVSALSPTTAPWVRKVVLDKLNAALGHGEFPMDTLWQEVEPLEILTILDRLPERREIFNANRRLLTMLWDWTGRQSMMTQQKVDSILLELLEPPKEVAGANHEWSESYASSWHDFLSWLEDIQNRQAMLKAHEDRLRKILDSPQFVPEHVLERIKKVLTEPTPAKSETHHQVPN